MISRIIYCLRFRAKTPCITNRWAPSLIHKKYLRIPLSVTITSCRIDSAPAPQEGGAMGPSSETNPSRGFWKPIFPAIVFLCTLPLVAQRAQETSPPKYDAHTETKMKGAVEEVKL